MLTKRTLLATLVVILVVMLSLLGCSKQPVGPKLQPADQQHTQPLPQQSLDHNIAPHPQQSPEKERDDESDAHISASPNEGDESDPAVDDGESPDADHKPETNNEIDNNAQPDTDEAVLPYNPSKPMLIGLTIGQNKERIKEKFGAPREEYVMEDPQDPITVYDYPGFLVGYDKHQLIAFIDINSVAINSGLNGLKLGDSIDVAVKALGNPDTRTAFVMNYHSTHATLKLDLDPHTQTISSIKLFGPSEY